MINNTLYTSWPPCFITHTSPNFFPSAHSSVPFSTYLAITWKSISEITESDNVGFSTLNTSVLSSNIFFHIITISTRWIILLFPIAQSPLHSPTYGIILTKSYQWPQVSSSLFTHPIHLDTWLNSSTSHRLLRVSCLGPSPVLIFLF